MVTLATHQDNRRLGQRLASLRTRLGKTQIEMAQALNVAPRTYQNYERGEREIAASSVRNLHRLFDVDPVWLLDGQEEEPEFRRDGQYLALMRIAIEEVEKKLVKARKTMTPAKKADLILLIYRHFAAQDGSDDTFVDQALKLVA
ncbi:transcriptional regulator with XRE-family HTH domain [Brevundimonas nasdae]|uniref:helix-turn-helix domain-containing protein n=1 Tax=Brevundimonas nasdae TaxID=172043 RepID=UPI001912F2BD|nr:helix-turn-helix transcriptional regulator [Brevundimonas nasdae]MBK6025379.1 helix-turn-helix transcriptional regulator [Brevundimonas nasdae]MDQ0451837.1 transcriptional regulator with XRE-family HTH domain [Brevundimonas nasdae]